MKTKNVFVLIAVFLLLLVILVFIKVNKPNLVYGQLINDLQEADTIAWISPDNDDEMLAGGVLALASLGYNKDVYVITQDLQLAIAVYPGTPEIRVQDNIDSKNFLELQDYIAIEEHIGSYQGTKLEKYQQYLEDFVRDKNLDLIITFENTNGFGNPGHVQWSDLLTKFAKEHNIKLYYLINRDPAVRYTYQGKLADLDPLPFTDTLNLDESFVMKNGMNISLWDAKFELVRIYSSSQPNAYSIIVTNPERQQELSHLEHYRKVN